MKEPWEEEFSKLKIWIQEYDPETFEKVKGRLKDFIRSLLASQRETLAVETNPEVIDRLGVLYDIAGKIYEENLSNLKGDASSDAAQMTAVLNGINKYIPFLTDAATHIRGD